MRLAKYTGPADIFLSYARQDSNLAESFAQMLSNDWHVAERMLTGEDGEARAKSPNLKSAGCVLVLWTRHSLDSVRVQQDALSAQSRGALLNVVMDDDEPVELPAAFTGAPSLKLPRFFSEEHPPYSAMRQTVKRFVPMRTEPKPPASVVFICYRRKDSELVARRLYDIFMRRIAAYRAFMDVDDIPLGTYFVTYINEQLKRCGAVVVLIGQSWTSITDEHGNRRLDDPRDHVRVEVATALNQKIPVIPILLQGVSMPGPDVLPEDIRTLAFHNGMNLTNEPWDEDIERLLKRLSFLIG